MERSFDGSGGEAGDASTTAGSEIGSGGGADGNFSTVIGTPCGGAGASAVWFRLTLAEVFRAAESGFLGIMFVSGEVVAIQQAPKSPCRLLYRLRIWIKALPYGFPSFHPPQE